MLKALDKKNALYPWKKVNTYLNIVSESFASTFEKISLLHSSKRPVCSFPSALP
jgi:hypothetical protein